MTLLCQDLHDELLRRLNAGEYKIIQRHYIVIDFSKRYSFIFSPDRDYAVSEVNWSVETYYEDRHWFWGSKDHYRHFPRDYVIQQSAIDPLFDKVLKIYEDMVKAQKTQSQLDANENARLFSAMFLEESN